METGHFLNVICIPSTQPNSFTPGNLPKRKVSIYLQYPGHGSKLYVHRQMNGSRGMWYMYTVEYHSATKRHEIGSFAVMWMDLEFVIQSEVSQREKNKYHLLMHIYGI